jgi:predicted metal-dependent phosphoesterase TrpH
MHVHTSCSSDSLIPVDDLLNTCDYNGIDCVAVTDHDKIDCALRLQEIAPSRIIVGEEIHTTMGEIIGLFLKEHIIPGLSPVDTVDKIKSQGGLVYVPHPFDKFRGSAIRRYALDEILPKVDIIEAYNSRNVFTWSNHKALSLISEKGILAGVGSDAHSRFEVGRAYVLMEPFTCAEDFLSNLAKAEYQTRKTPVMFNFANKIYKTARSVNKKKRLNHELKEKSMGQ